MKELSALTRVKNVVVVFSLIFCGLTYAQTKQNDATWEECLTFLTKYKEHLVYREPTSVRSMLTEEYYAVSQQGNNLKISQKIERTRTCISDDWTVPDHDYDEIGYRVITVPLEFLTQAEIKESKQIPNQSYIPNHIELSFVSKLNGVKHYAKTLKDNKLYCEATWYSKTIEIHVFDDKMRSRIAKMFIHLAFLSNEKRKKEDKF